MTNYSKQLLRLIYVMLLMYNNWVHKIQDRARNTPLTHIYTTTHIHYPP